jgi:helicase SWR1
MDRQCEDRAHRIGQIRDVHIYRFVSRHTVEEALLRKANQKRSLDDLVIQRGGFDWRTVFADAHMGALADALGGVDDAQDAAAAAVAAREAVALEGADDADFERQELGSVLPADMEPPPTPVVERRDGDVQNQDLAVERGEEPDEPSFETYMINWAILDAEFFDDWHV